MKKLLFLLLLVSFVGIGQTDYCDIDFSFSDEGEISSAGFLLDSDDFQNNDVIGVFYNSSIGLQCIGSATYIAPNPTIFIKIPIFVYNFNHKSHPS